MPTPNRDSYDKLSAAQRKLLLETPMGVQTDKRHPLHADFAAADRALSAAIDAHASAEWEDYSAPWLTGR